jgi:hypothetical protein
VLLSYSRRETRRFRSTDVFTRLGDGHRRWAP